MVFANESEYKKIMQGEIEPFLESIRKDSYTESFDGEKIHLEIYEHPDEKGAVMVLHGFTESAQKFREMSFAFYKNGYSVYAVDLRGHGLSARASSVTEKVEEDDFECYAKDLEIIVQKEILPKLKSKNFYIYSHSLGSTAALLYMINCPDKVKKVVLSSPMICGNMGMPVGVAAVAAKIICAVGGKRVPAPGRCVFNPEQSFEESDATSKARFDYYHLKRVNNPLLQTSGPAFGWVNASLKARDKILQNANTIKTPLLVFLPQSDKQLLSEYTKTFAEKASAKVICTCGTKHEIFFSENDTLQQYCEDIISFFDE